ncbi:VCBS domain-containing protein [Pseudomonas sp. GNP012]
MATVSAPAGALGTLVATVSDESTGDAAGSVGWTYTLNNSAAQYLAEGQTKTEVFTVTLTDDFGATVTKAVTITLTGTNDQPTLTIDDTTGAMNEGNGTATLSDSGALSFADLDSNDVVTVSQTANNDIAWSGGTLGAAQAAALVAGFSVDQTGWNYSSSENLDFLSVGETISFSYTVVASDDSGAGNATSAPQTVTITLTGTNDQPTLTIDDTTGAMNEGNGTATLSDSGALSFADLDSNDVVTVSQTANNDIAWSGGTLGAAQAAALVAGFSVDQTGWNYSSSENLDFLSVGETISFSYTVVASDDSGTGNASSAAQTVTITLTGTNDAPVLSFEMGNDAGAVQEDTTLSVTGQFSSADIDHDATATWSIAGTDTGTYGSIAVDNSGQWTYTLANGTDGVASAVQSLKAGESHDEVFTVQVSDGLGGVDTQLVNITITGSNDAPVLSFATGNDAGAVQEDTKLSVTGQFSSADIDHDATATWSIAGTDTGTYGSIAVDNSGQWTYTLANGTDGVASAVQSLKAGESHNEVFSVQVSDGLGGVDTQQVTITITGSNDAPVLSFATGNDAGAVQEDTKLSVTGQFSSTDIDHDATTSWSINGSPTGTYGSIAVDNSGQWTYTLANGTDGVASAVQSLKAGESHNEVFSVQVSDGLGGVDTQQVTITITGSNDAPVLSFATGNDAGAVQEDTTLSVTGQFSSADIDHDATATWSIAGSNTGTYGSIAVDNSGQWTYTLANGTDGVAGAVQSLKAGESHNEVFSVQVSDGLGGVDTQQVTITVTGSNDAAVLSSASVTLSETNAPLTTGGSLTISDIDSPESFQAQSNTAGSYGQFSIGTGGAWTYVANSAHNEFAAGTTYTDTFAVSSADGTLTSVTVHILGTNDAAVLSADIANLTETNAAVDISTTGTLTISDVDSAATFVAQTNTAGSYGQFSIGTGGAWTYVANSAHNEFAAGTTYTDTFAVSSADGTLTSVTVHILGTNDAAVLSADIANLTETNAAVDISTTGTLTISDVDSATTFVAQTNTAGSYGQFSIGTGGAWTYVANSAHNEFAAGTTYTDTFAVSSADGTLTSVTVHILGTNDAAVLSADIANLTETNAAVDISTTGTLTISDVDSATTFVAQTNTAGSYGQFSIGTGGAWTYVANSAHNEFAAGTTYTDTFAVSSADGTLTSVTVHILGTNDAAVLSADIANLTETNAAVDISTTGTLTISDVDSAATFVAQTNTAGSYGQFSIGTGGAWTYVANSAHNEFAAGTTYTDTFAVSSADGTLTSVTVHILGTNDAAVLSADIANLTETNAAVDISTTGTLTISDVDSATTFVAQTNTAGSYGQFSIGTGGAWTYVANSAHNEFAAGTTYTDTFAVSSADGTLTSVTVHILGTNDAAVLSADIVNLTETNAAVDISTTGTLTISDVDSATTFVAQTNTAGSYGQFSIGTGGAWTYVANSAHNEFAAGTTYTDTFAVSSADGTLTSVTVNILGTNDAAVLSADIAHLTETNAAVDISTAGTLTISDVDSAATFVAQTNTAGSYGQFSIGTDGAWTYVADSAHNEFAAGTTYTDTFAVSSADGTLTSVTVHILGTNDAAVLSADIANLTETNAAVDISTTGTLTISDVDSATTFVAQTNTAGSYGQFSIGTGGAWTYVANSAHNEFAAGTTYTDTFAVSSADGTLTSVTVHILGTNDAAVLSADIANLTETNAAVDISTTGTLTISDVDSATTFVAQTNTAGSYGQFSIGTGGAWTYVANSAHNEFAAGTTYTDTFAVSSADGTLTSVAVHIAGSNDSPTITSNGGGATASINVAENTAAVTTVVATDADLPAQTLSYSLLNTAGTDFSKFSISSSGVLTFNSAPDYESPQDVGGTDGDNAYVVDVQVSDGNGGVDTQTITVNVQNVVETPVDTVAPTVTVTGTALGNSMGSTSTVTFQFSETVSGFNLSDVAVSTTSGTPRGTFSNFTQVDGDTYTATLTRTLGGSIKVDVAANSYTDLAGNPGAAGSSANLPAGVAGEPVNLALNVPLADISGPVTVTISGVPSGWMFNAGTDNGDGTWTVQTSDPGALTVTTPREFAGALVLDVNLYWSNSDGSTASAYVFNNVEIYAPDAPIFALSTDDNLTGSSGADTFVFARPIGNNVIYSFDATADKIDLIGFTGVNDFADVSIVNDASGNAVLSISADQTITINGVDAAALSGANLLFDVDPVTTNTGTLTIADGAIMPFGGSIDNSGTIALGSTGSEAELEILFRGATLTGGGQVVLSDSAHNVIFGGSADTVLTNADNTISGAGQLGAGQMMLVNSGLILASGVNALVIDTGSSAVTNTGVLQASGSGGLLIESALVNSGSLWANDGNITIHGDAAGGGSATISGSAMLEFAAASDQHVTFDSGAAGTLKLDVATAFSGSVSGFAAGDKLDFGDIAFGADTQITYAANDTGTGGLLMVSDGAHAAQIALNGQYAAAGLQANAEGSGSELAYDAAAANHRMLGGLANDTLVGGAGDDLFLGGQGNDTFYGGLGNDTFMFAAAGFGNDSIQDFDINPSGGQDLLNIAGTGINSETFAANVSIAADGADTVIGIGVDSIRLVGVSSAGIDQADFILAV